MKVRDAIKELLEYNLDAELEVSTGDTFDDVSDFSFSYGGPDSGDGESKKDTKHVYINVPAFEGKYIEQIQIGGDAYNLPCKLPISSKLNRFKAGDSILIPYKYYNKIGCDYVKALEVSKSMTHDVVRIIDITSEYYMLENLCRLKVCDADKVMNWTIRDNMTRALKAWVEENGDSYISMNNHNEVYLSECFLTDLVDFLEDAAINSENLDND